MFESVAKILIGFILGSFAGHKFSLSRDKRKEHNDVVRPLKNKVLNIIDGLKKGFCDNITEQDINKIRSYLPEKKFNQIKKAYGEYNKFYSKKINSLSRDKYGIRSSLNDYDLNEILKHVEKINDLLKVK